MKVKELPLDDRPREKLCLRGSQSLSDSELVAILLRTGIKGKSAVQLAQQLITQFENLNQLSMQSIDSLKKIAGIGKDKAATLSAAFEIGRRADSQKKWFSNKSITAPSDIADIFIPLLRDKQKEEFYVICLNSANKIIKYEKVTEGILNSSVVHQREIFKVAIEANSANIILLHNHPSGNCEPSNEDISFTKKMVEAGNIIDIKIFDHIIISGNFFTSLVEKRVI